MAEVEHGSHNEPDERLSTTSDHAENDTLDNPSPPPVLRADKIELQDEAHWKEVEPISQKDPSDLERNEETTETQASDEPDHLEHANEESTSDEVVGSTPEKLPEEENEGDNSAADVQNQESSDIPEKSPDEAPEPRERSDSRSTTATQQAARSTPVSSTVFVVTALDNIGSSKEARRDKELGDAVQNALANIKQSEQQPIDPEVIFLPLQLATRTFSIPLQVTALDCIGKLISYSYFAFPSAYRSPSQEDTAAPQPPLIERAIETICDCFENEATPVEIQQQIIKSLLAAVLNDKIVVHGAGLLKAVRQIYNIFIYSKSTQNQQVAQGSLTQMVGTVFDRVRFRLDLKEGRLREHENNDGDHTPSGTYVDPSDANNSNDQERFSDAGSIAAQPVAKEPTEKLTLQSFESSKDDAMVNDNAPTMVTRANAHRKAAHSISSVADNRDENDPAAVDEEDEIYVKDAFLVFRALCKLSHKILSHDQQQDVKSQHMRSKLLSLHLIHHLLNNHISIFTSPIAYVKNSTSSSDPMTLMQAVKPHLCLSLSRNGSSSVIRVFEVCCEIFWLMLKHMRVMLKVSLHGQFTMP